MPLFHFLLVYDLDEQRLVSKDQFDDAAVAATAYAELEQRHRGDRNLEIVLVGADSIETIESTHGNYFNGGAHVGASPFVTAS